MPVHVLHPVPGHPVESLSSTRTQNEFGAVLERVSRGTVVEITKHEKPSAVLLSVEMFERLLAERVDPLEGLRARFDARFAKMQSPPAKAGVQALFSAGPKELGKAAVKAARRRG
jgi:antitoxin Phd